MFDLVADPAEQRNLLPTEANDPAVLARFNELKDEISRLQREYDDDDRYADSADWLRGSADGPFHDKQPLGKKTVAEAVAAAAGH